MEHMIICPNSDCGAEISMKAEKCPVCETNLNEAMIARATEAIKQNPKDAQNFVARGYAYAAKGDNERALADLDYAIILDGNSADAYGIRGMKRLEMGNHQGALADLNYAIKLSPNDEDAHVYRGLTHAALEDTKSALIDFDQVIKINPKRADVYMERAKLLANGGNASSAMIELEKALQNVTDPYERTQIEKMYAEAKAISSQQSQERIRYWLSGWRLRLIIGLFLLLLGLMTNGPGFFLLALFVIGGWPVIRAFFKAVFR